MITKLYSKYIFHGSIHNCNFQVFKIFPQLSLQSPCMSISFNIKHIEPVNLIALCSDKGFI